MTGDNSAEGMSAQKMNLTVLQSTRCIFNPLWSLRWGINTMLSRMGPTSHELLVHFNLSPVLHIIKVSDFSSLNGKCIKTQSNCCSREQIMVSVLFKSILKLSGLANGMMGKSLQTGCAARRAEEGWERAQTPRCQSHPSTREFIFR